MKKVKIIENYLDGSLSPDERLEFEKMLVSEKNFSEEIKFHKEVNDAIRDEKLNEFRQLVHEMIHAKTKTTSIFNSFSVKLIKFHVAASIILLLAFSLWKLLSIEPPEKIFSDFYNPYPTDISTRSIGKTNDNLQLSCLLYEEGDYNKSFNLLQGYISENPENLTASFFIGLNAIALAKYDIAIKELKKTEADAITPFAVHARWYLALTYLKTNRFVEARKYFELLIKGENCYSEKAKKVLKKLKS